MKSKTFSSTTAELLTGSDVSTPMQGYVIRILLAASLFVASFLWASPAKAAPVIQLMTPQSGPVGTLVVIVGSGFGASQGTSTVTFNGTLVTWVSWSATSLEVQVPAGASSGNVVVTVSGKASNAESFTVTQSPVITGLSPTSGAVGATITITGSNFTAGGTQSPQVVFNPELYASPISSTDTSITVAVPAGAVTGDLLVSVGGGNSNSILFTVTSSDPSIGNLTPGAGVVGTSVTITGTNFGTSQGTSTVTFNGTTGTPTSWSATSIKVPVPSSATTGNVLVTVGGVASNPYGFEVGTAAPSITSISPTSGAVATSVTITGTSFGSTQGANTVNFNGVSGVPTSWSATQIKVPVPKGATTGSVVVTASGTVSNSVNFTVPGTGPSVTSVSPSSGPVGTSVTVTGTNFDATQGTSTVTFNGIAATATGWSPTSIVATVPSSATSGSVVVSVDGTASSGISFAVAPGITSLSPSSGAVGTSITISGTSFGSSQGTSSVTFNGTAATPTSWGASSITVPVPNGATTGNVAVTVSGVASNGVSFTVLPTPSIASLSPTSGTVGASVTITGSNFGATQGTSMVAFNGTVGTPTSWSTTSVVVPVPTGATTGNVVVTVGGIASNDVAFTLVVPPSIASLSPSSGTVGTSVTITGNNFGATQGTSTVAFNGTVGTPTSWSTTSIVLPVPSGATTGNVVVTVNGIASGGISFGVQSSGFVATSGQMAASRYGQTATQLITGQVLITGGMSTSSVVNTAELYTPSSQTFALATPMNVARWLHTATLLNDGTVLITGGSDLANQETLDTAEIYNPVAGTFTLLPATLNTARVGHTATLLSNGQVLLVGGYDPETGIIADAELYDPIAQVFIDLGDTNTPRYEHSATLLQNGQVLIAGGETDPTPTGAYNSAEVFNLATWTFTPLSVTMTTAREGHAATLLNNGQVLITGGDLPGTGSLNTGEIYDPTANTFTALSATMTTPRIYHDSVLLNGGQVLLSGGEHDAGGNSTGLNTAEVYNPTALTFTAVPGNMTSVREHQIATLLNDGTVLEDGGTDGTNIFNTAEIYTTSKLTGLASIAVSPASPSVLIGTQQLLVATGTFSDGSTQVLSSVLWSSSSPSVSLVSNDATDAGFTASVAPGTVTITATAVGISGSSMVTVTAPSLVSITLNPQSPTLPLGTTQQFSATGTYSDGSIQDLTLTATWTSSSASATVNSSGLVAGVQLGTSSIQATLGTVSCSTSVTITAPVLVSLTLTPSTSTIAYGATQQYQVIGTYTDGSSNNLTNSMSWFAVPSETASINGSGLATGLAEGTATITALNGAVFATGTLAVQAQAEPSLVTIVVTPNQASIPVGSSQQFVATGNYSDGSTQDITSTVTWTSSGSGVASVNSSGLATAATQGSSTLTATSGSLTGSATISVTASTLALNTSRYEHSATLLNNGSVLIAGGVSCPSVGSCTYLNSAELYNPGSGTIGYTGSLATARSAPAVLLGNGKVLVAGGYNCDTNGNCASLNSAEIYDPNSSTFSSAGNMTIDRYGHTMTLLPNGKVLIAAGESCSSSTSCTALNTAELYDPVAGTFTATGSLTAARFNASAAVVSSGQVLIAGGYNGSTYPAAAELYDPVAGTFSVSASLNTPRANATATWVEGSSMVLIAGGSTCSSPACPTASTEYYQSGNFTFLSNMTVPRLNQTATLLTNGQLFLSGGFDSCSSSCVSDATSELYNPQSFSFTSSQALSTGRSGHTATLLLDGSVLLVGGINNGITLASTDSYQPSSQALPQLTSISITPSNSPLAVGSTLPLMATGNGVSSYLLQPVLWSSSSPSVATVSNAAGSAGIVNALSAGTTTITATVGTISATAQITVTAQLVSITVAPVNPSITLNSSQALQLTATGNYSDGSSNNLTPYVTWTDSNGAVATLVQNSAVTGSAAVVIPVGVGTANFTATFGSASGSSSVSVVAPPTPVAPNVVSVSPTTGSAGTQVTITGSGFGATQGSGTVWLGTTLGSIVSWSDSQVIANVSTGSSSGVAVIQQAGVPSNSVPFTINTAMISNITPTSGVPGTQVTITGSGFGATQSNGLVLLGNTAGVVTNWSDGQVVATVPPGAASGNAQILQNGVWSNAVTFTINLPHIVSVTPTSGAAGTQVTIAGNGFGATQASGVVWMGNIPGTATSWSDSQVVATVASGALTGIVKVEQNGIWSNAVTFTVPASGNGGSPVYLTPNVINMVVGGTQSIQALNASNQSVTGLAWTSSNTSVATLSTDDPPVITAVAPGSTTITAGNASADVTVWPFLASASSLPMGTVVCRNPGDGSGVISIIPAVPSSSGVADVFALQEDGNVLAMNSDCTIAWSAYVGTGNTLIADFQGGLVVANLQSIYKLDGITGQAYPAYNSVSGTGLATPVVHTDGTVFTVDGSTMVGINPQTGQPNVSVQMDNSTYTDTVLPGVEPPNCYDSPVPQSIGSETSTTSPPSVGQLIIAGDGYAYVPYTFQTTTMVGQNIAAPETKLCSFTSTTVTNAHQRLLRVGTGGDSYVIPLGDWTSTTYLPQGGIIYQSAPVPNVVSATLTNADTGVLFSWETYTSPYCAYTSYATNPITEGGCVGETSSFNLATTSGPSLVSQTSPSVPGQTTSIYPALQLQGGLFVGIIGTQNGYSMIAFDQYGSVNWTVPNDSPQIALSNGGLIGASGVTYDQNGNATGQLPNLPTYSWLGNAYQLGSIDEEVANALVLASSWWAFAQANSSGNNTASQQTEYPQLVSCYDKSLQPQVQCPGKREMIWNAYKALAMKNPNASSPQQAILTSNMQQIQEFVFNKLLDANGNTYQVSSFLQYLQNGFSPFDGTTSTAPLVGTLIPWSISNYLIYGGKVKGTFADGTTAAATIPSKTPLTTFFNPAMIDGANYGANSSNIAMVFHEGIHGFTGITDAALQSKLGCVVHNDGASENISYFLKQFVAFPPLADGNIQPCTVFH